MQNSYKLLVFVGFLGAFSMFCSDTSATDVNDKAISRADLAAVLKSYVNDTGMVNYKQLKTSREKLDTYIASVGKLNVKTYKKWSEKTKIAFWLNVYNAFTLKAIIDNYPIKPSFFKSRFYPKNSIRQIKGVWDKMAFNVMGRGLTLEYIEHKVLRKEFDEPRIHMAMVCAAIGCPLLRNEPYIGEKLDCQLDDQTRKFLANPEKFKIDENTLGLSPIFKWFSEDFITKYGSKQNIAKHNKETSAILNFIAAHLKNNNRDYVLKGQFKIKYLKYDWSLNEQAK
ncbi:MAG: DUF547 domain-containing protein [Planctomycetota bacterium]|jgi:hypothetical protein